MKKVLVVLICLVAVLAPSFAQGSKEKVNNVSICTPYMSSVTTKQMVDIIKSELEKANIKVSVFDSANDNSKFASDIETSVVSKVNGIIIVSIDPSLCEAQLKEAAAAGIPVFGVDSGYIEGVMQMNATSDNYQMGEAIIKYLFKLMGEKGTLVHLTYRAHPGVVKRTLALEALLPQYPNIKELSEFHVDVPNQINNAKEIVENVLTTYPQKGSVTAIMCAWDEPAIGATQALMEAGRDEVLVVGVDGNEQAVQLIKQGTNLKATMAQDFDGMAKLVAAECIKAVSGQATLKGEQYVPAILIEK